MRFLYFFTFITIAAAIIFLWLFTYWLIFSTLHEHWGYTGLISFSYLIATIIFFQGTRLQRWANAL